MGDVRKLGLVPLAAYGVFGLPLAMAALPLYVHLPNFYATEHGLALGLVGLILLATRLVDALSDPLIGYWSDRLANRRGFVLAAIPLLTLGMIGLFSPLAAMGPALWLVVAVVVTYLGFSMASIAYQAWGAELSSDPHERTRITASREVFSLVGVVVASALPAVLGGGNAVALERFALLFAALAVVCGALTLLAAPRPNRLRAPSRSFVQSLSGPLANRRFRWLVVVFVCSGIAAAIPSTLVLFFIADVLRASASSAMFLITYFIAAAAGLPLWVILAKRIGKRRAWLAGMLLSIAAFMWAYGLGPGDTVAFGIICALSGIALGADLALPASMLADVIDDDQATHATEGAYFGLWNLLTKANLAAAAGIALPFLGAIGYQPGGAAHLGALS
ncbi:MAG: MFS transporter, partial [Burkholderiales bacterium]